MTATTADFFYQDRWARGSRTPGNDNAVNSPEATTANVGHAGEGRGYGGLLEGIGPTASELTFRRIAGDAVLQGLKVLTRRRSAV